MLQYLKIFDSQVAFSWWFPQGAGDFVPVLYSVLEME
jgi:hypothetical protein